MMNRMPVRMKEQTGQTLRRLHVKITAFLLVFAMACTAMASLPMEVFAVDPTSGYCGSDLTWNFNGSSGTLTISGSGDMSDYSLPSYVPWNSYFNVISNVEFNGKITSIGDRAFCDLDNVTSINIPNTIIRIGECAFSHSNLSSITIPNSVTVLCGWSFAFCDNLTSVTLPDSITQIEDYTFAECKKLVTVSLSNTIVAINEGAFAGCSSLTEITIPNSVTYIDDVVFDGCTNLTNIAIPNSVTKIGNSSFAECSSLTTITIPNSVSSIVTGAFHDCSNLINAEIFSSIESIPYNLFERCYSLETVTIPKSVTSIKAGAFYKCDKLTDVYYEGTQTEWIKINIEKNNNPLLNATIHYNSGGPTTGTEQESILKLDKTTLQLAVNKSVTLNAAIDKKIVSNEVLTWTSGDNKIATVSKSGKVTGVKAGKTTIYAKSSNGYLAKCEVTVTSVSTTDSITIDAIPSFSKPVDGPTVTFLGKSFSPMRVNTGIDIKFKYVSYKYDAENQKIVVKFGRLKDNTDDKLKDDKEWMNEYKEIKDFTKAVSKKNGPSEAGFGKFRDYYSGNKI